MSGGQKQTWTYGNYSAGGGSSGGMDQPEWEGQVGDWTHGWKTPQPIDGTLLAVTSATGEVHDVKKGEGGESRTTEADLPEHKHAHDLNEDWKADKDSYWTDGKGNLFKKKRKAQTPMAT